MALSARQAVELFHIVFLRALVAKGEDKGLFAVKGGCNLRFFFGSVRYSEDIDFDVVVVAKEMLKNRVDRLLLAPTVVSPFPATHYTATTAIAHAMGLSFDDYSAQVVAYLSPDEREVFEGRDAWNTIQDTVVSTLESLP